MGKVTMTNAQTMNGRLITVDTVDCYPSNHYPNGGDVHSHDFYEIELMLSGSGTVIINGVPVNVLPGCCYLICPGDYHKYSLDTDNRLVMYNIKFNHEESNAALVEELTKAASPTVAIASEGLCERMKYECELLKVSVGENPILSKNALERVLIYLLEAIKENEPENAVREIEQIRKITDYVSENYKNKITIGEVARMMNLSENYLGIYFKKHTGQCFSDYVRDVRVCRAARLLSTTRLSVKEVAYRTGFCSAEYLSRAFKGFFGISPIEHRKKHRVKK